MAYQDPYAEPQGRYGGRPHYGGSSSDFNPYTTTQQPHQTYEQDGAGTDYDNYAGGYRDEPVVSHRQPSQRTGHIQGLSSVSHGAAKEMGGYDHEDFVRGEKTPRSVRQYRHQAHGNLWTKGSRIRCCGRFFCCTVLIAIVLVLGIGLSLALWIRPPNVVVGDVAPVTNGSVVQLETGGVKINMGVDIFVNNPNYFSATLKSVVADIIYPINNTNIGGGELDNLVFHSHTQQNFTFSFTIDYKTANDPKGLILLDLAQKCGVVGTRSNISVDYKLKLAIRVLFITISPTISNTVNFACPLTSDQISDLLKGSGFNIPGLPSSG